MEGHGRPLRGMRNRRSRLVASRYVAMRAARYNGRAKINKRMAYKSGALPYIKGIAGTFHVGSCD